MIEIVSYLLAFSLGIFVCYAYDTWRIRRTRSSGTVQVSTDGEKMSYLLVLDDDLENIERKKSLLFKVDISRLDSDRG